MGKQLAERYAKQYALLYGKLERSLELPPEDCRAAVCVVLSKMDENNRKHHMAIEKFEISGETLYNNDDNE